MVLDQIFFVVFKRGWLGWSGEHLRLHVHDFYKRVMPFHKRFRKSVAILNAVLPKY